MCQCPKRADFISTKALACREGSKRGVNALSGLISFLLKKMKYETMGPVDCVNALSGLISFLQYPLETLINTGFPGSVLQVFVRIF